MTTETQNRKKKNFFKRHIELTLALVKIAVLALALFVSFGVVLGVHTAKNEYMNPGVKYHDNVIYSRRVSDVALRDVVLYEHDGETYLGRVVGRPGDTITVDVNGYIFQNSHLVYEENIQYTTNRSLEVTVTLGDDEYFLINDDRAQNFDSRQFGPINKDDFKGKAIVVLRRYGI